MGLSPGGARAFGKDVRGSTALLVALMMPVVLIVSLGAVQIQAVVTDRQRTQDIADAAALWGAQQLMVTSTGADERTIAFADAQLTGVRVNSTATVTAAVLDKSTMKVVIDTTRPSFFFNLMPLGGFQTHVESIAEGANQTPLCVLIVGPDANDDIHATGDSAIEGPECLIHSNHAVRADSKTRIVGKAVEASTTGSGPIRPAASAGAPPVDDPFASLSYNPPLACLTGSGLPNMAINSDKTLLADTPTAAVHQANIIVDKGATLTLGPGVHYFCGDLEVKGNSRLDGSAGVTLVFAKDAQVKWKDAGYINLNGSKTGAFAGFVLLLSRTETKDFHIDADAITNITGALYVPSARLVVDGSKKSGLASAWTVLAAEALNVNGGANLVINVDYSGSDVPVPGGVGNNRGTTHLR